MSSNDRVLKGKRMLSLAHTSWIICSLFFWFQKGTTFVENYQKKKTVEPQKKIGYVFQKHGTHLLSWAVACVFWHSEIIGWWKYFPANRCPHRNKFAIPIVTVANHTQDCRHGPLYQFIFCFDIPAFPFIFCLTSCSCLPSLSGFFLVVSYKRTCTNRFYSSALSWGRLQSFCDRGHVTNPNCLERPLQWLKKHVDIGANLKYPASFKICHLTYHHKKILDERCECKNEFNMGLKIAANNIL